MVNFLFFLPLGLWGVAEKSERPDFHDPVALKGIIAKAVQLEAVKKADGSMQYLEPLELSSYQGSGWGWFTMKIENSVFWPNSRMGK